jgi:uncharacterized damage-inducible protein DinB
MDNEKLMLSTVFDGWQGHQISLVKAVEGLTREQLAYRSVPGLRSVGEIVNHIAGGRADWLSRIGEVRPEFSAQLQTWDEGDDDNVDAQELVRRLEFSWQLVEEKLNNWNVNDLLHVYPLPYGGKTYALSRQWVLWRIMAHDLHHGGELALMLGEQGIAIPELGMEGGHIIMPPQMQE